LYTIVWRKCLWSKHFKVLFILQSCPLLPTLSLNQQKSPLYCHPQNRIITGNNLPAVKIDLATHLHLLFSKDFPFLGNQRSFLPSNLANCIPNFGTTHIVALISYKLQGWRTRLVKRSHEMHEIPLIITETWGYNSGSPLSPFTLIY
jgi:hypothetical protein